jgi:hypothetical protein
MARDRGNFVSEWFGHRVYPAVAGAQASLSDQFAHIERLIRG